MDQKMVKATIKYLEGVVGLDPDIDSLFGFCRHCGNKMINYKIQHKSDCHYIEAKRLLDEFKEILIDYKAHTSISTGLI